MEYEQIEWAKKHKKEIEEFEDFLKMVKDEINLKAKKIGTFIEAEKDQNQLENGRVWYYNKTGNAQNSKNLATACVVELDKYGFGIDNSIEIDKCYIGIIFRNKYHKDDIVNKLKEINIKKDFSKSNYTVIYEVEDNENYEEIARKNIEILKLFQ